MKKLIPLFLISAILLIFFGCEDEENKATYRVVNKGTYELDEVTGYHCDENGDIIGKEYIGIIQTQGESKKIEINTDIVDKIRIGYEFGFSESFTLRYFPITGGDNTKIELTDSTKVTESFY